MVLDFSDEALPRQRDGCCSETLDVTLDRPGQHRRHRNEALLVGTDCRAPGRVSALLFLAVEALALDDRRREAVDLFAELLDRASPLGLYAEEMDPKTGEHLGNYPQALTHAALVQAALALRDLPPVS
ncbi:glycoside hydrolase family 15 protein [Kribbella sp. NPDC050459]|uniref:glycoside hydrolase family 15 protein n=1 Tax=Kribbella sp. NPDC050459 TaxID=3155785 RepID=UPI0033C5229C